MLAKLSDQIKQGTQTDNQILCALDLIQQEVHNNSPEVHVQKKKNQTWIRSNF